MKREKKFLIFVVIFVTASLLFSCSSSGDDDNNTDGTSDDVVENITRPDGWSEETHGDDVDPDYGVVFQQGAVLRLDLTIESNDWQEMLADMTELYGEFGKGTGLPGNDGPPPDQGPLPGDGGQGQGPGMPPGGNPGDIGGPGVISDENPIWKPCTLVFEDNEWYHVGVRFKGNSSLRDTWGKGLLKLPFRFDFDQFEDDFPEIDDQRFFGFKKLSLSSNYTDASFIREKVVADIFRDAGVPAPQTAFYRLYIDHGEGPVYFGLYTMVEIPADPMLEQQFSDPDGNLYKPEGVGATFSQYVESAFDKETNEDEADYSDVLALFNALQSNSREEDTDAWKSGLEAVLDVDGFLRWLAVNTVIQNWDTYGIMSHNYYLYNDPGDGLLHWIPWDNNMSLNSEFKNPLSLNLTSDEVDENWPLIRYIVDDADYWARYVTYVGETATNFFEPEKMKSIYAAAHDLVRPYAVGAYGEIEGYSLINADDPEAAFDSALEYLNIHVDNRYDEATALVEENGQ